MLFIKSKFVVTNIPFDKSTHFTEELENATSEQFAEFKFEWRVDKWYDLITGYYSSEIYKDKQLRLLIIETILKYKNEQDGKNRSFVIEKYEQ